MPSIQDTPPATGTTPTPEPANRGLPISPPSAKDLAEAGPSGCSSTMRSGHVSPQDILPIPNPKKKQTNKGPKPMECAVVTSSPYKLALEEAEKKRNEKLNEKEDSRKRKTARGNKTNKKSKTTAKKKIAFEKEKESDEDENGDDFDAGESVLENDIGVFEPDDEDAVCLFCGGTFS